jgi:hypothetical protein
MNANHERVYQQIYRTCARRDDNNITPNLVIPSLTLFPKYIEERFKTVNKIKLGNLIEPELNKGGRPRTVDPNIKRKHQYIIDLTSKFNKGIDFKETKDLLITVFNKPLLNDNGGIKSINLYGNHKFSHQEFFNFMEKWSQIKAQAKHDNLLFSLATFKDNRALNINVQQVYGVLFDFDTIKEEGLINYDKVVKVFGEVVECLIYSTHSGGYKRRLLVLFQEPITYDEAKEVYSHLGRTFLNEYPECGLDIDALLNVAQPYYFPRKSDNSVFIIHSGKKFDAKTYLIGSSPFGLLESEVVYQDLNIRKMSYDEEVDYYNRIIIPLLDELGPGDRWFKAQSILGKVYRKANLFEDQMFRDFALHEVDEETIRKLKSFWKAIKEGRIGNRT